MARKKTALEQGAEHLGAARRLITSLVASRFFIVSAAVHVGVLAIFGGVVVFETIRNQVTGQFETGDFIALPPGPPAAPPPENTSTDVSVDIPATDIPTSSAPEMKDIIVSESTAAPSFMPEISVATTVGPDMEKVTDAVKNMPVPKAKSAAPAISKDRINAINNRIGKGAADGGYNVSNAGGGVTGVQGQFTCYVARYAEGDWDHNVRLSGDGQRIVYGSIPNLMTQITRWNKRLRANIEAVPINLSDRQTLFNSKPPVAFLYFTGHRDFRLTDAEVATLRDFILAGGVIWGDAGMPGRNSRFDIAFRREMRRILPDPDQDFQPIDDKHEIFQQKGTLVKTTPPGLNYYREPIEVMMVGDQIGVIYTLNSYGNLWQIALDPRGKVLEVFDSGDERKPNETYTNGTLWGRRDTYYRNINEQSVSDAYKLGINVVVHILLQYQAAISGASNLPK